MTAERCPKCEGLFLDKGEIRRITGNEHLNDLLTKHLALDSDTQRVCPECGWVMDMEDADGVRVDVCLKCFGAWLDHGELEALKGKGEEAFDPARFTPEKLDELRRAKAARTRDRKTTFKFFLGYLRDPRQWAK